MADETDFEPRLGPIGRGARRQSSQLKALARMARWGKPHQFGRKRMAPGSVWAKGRGKGAAAVARHWADPGRRRAIVSVKIAPARGTNTAAFASHLKYIQRDGTDRSGDRTALFDRNADEVSAGAFNNRSAGDEHQFRIIVSPEDSGRMSDLPAFTRRLMEQVDRDFRTRTDWVAAAHYNTAQPHVHLVIRGRNAREGVLIIARTYCTGGFRHRAEEILTRELGPRTWRERSASRLKEVSAERVTSLDQALVRTSENGWLRLDDADAHLRPDERARAVERLRHLQTLGLARHVFGDEWRLADRWRDTLEKLQDRSDLVRGAWPEPRKAREHPGMVLELPASDTAWITGRLTSRTRNRAAGSGEIVLVDAVDGRAWVWQATSREAEELPQPGAVITVQRPASAPRTGSSPEQTSGAQDVQPIRLYVNSWLPVGQLTDRPAFTWLDELSEETVARYSAGFGADVRAAKLARQAFLLSRPLDLTAMEDLRRTELADAARSVEIRLGKRYAELQSREVFRGEYIENLDTAYGRFAVIAGNTRFALVAISGNMATLRGQSVTVDADLGHFAASASRNREIERW
jgi:type IV secretory pathway VirD2 relaxase